MNELSLALTFKVVDEASKELKRLNTEFGKITNNWEKAGFAIGASLKVGITAAVGGIGALTKAAIDNADEMGKMAQKSGVTVEAFSALAYAAKLSDVNNQQLQTSLKGLNESLVDSQDKNSKAAKAFEYLGIATKNVDGSLRKADQVFADIADKFAKMPDGASKTALAMDLMKKSGVDMIPMLNAGKEGLEEMRIEAEKLGLVISKEQAQQAEQFNDSMTRIGNAAGGVGMAIANEVLPTLNALAGQLIDIIKTSPSFKKFGEGVAAVFKFIIKAAAGVIFVFKSIGEGLGALAAAAVAFFTGDFKGAGRIMGEYIQTTKEAALRTGEFMDAIDKGVPAIESSANATDKATQSTKEYTRETEKTNKEVEKRNKLFTDLMADLSRQIEGVDKLSKAQQVEWELQKGKYADLLPKQKELVRLKLLELEASQKLKVFLEQQYDANAKIVDQREGMKRTLGDLENHYNNTIKQGRWHAEIMKQTTEQMRLLDDEYRSVLEAQKRMLELDPNNKEELSKLEQRAAALKKVREEFIKLGTVKELSDTNVVVAQTEMGLAAWNKHIEDARYEAKLLNAEAGLLRYWLKQGVITTQEFAVAMEGIDARRLQQVEQGLTKVQKKMKDVATEVQGMFGNFFYNAMQGQFDNILVSFKQMLDRMVAEALAKNLADAIFGGMSRTGTAGGWGGNLIGGFLKMIGFRENGGPVTKGQPYIVGEKRPEVFIPKTSGTIIPSLQQAQGMYSPASTNINFAITAMDSQDVLRSLDKIKRPLAEMMNGTNRTYNLGR